MQYEYGHVFIFCSTFCSYQLVVVVLIVVHHTAVHVHTAANPYLKGNFLSTGCTSDPGWHIRILLPRVPPVCISASHFFQPPVCLIRVHMIWYICIEKRFRGTFRWDWDLGSRNTTSTATSLQSNLIRRQNGKCIRRQHMRAYRWLCCLCGADRKSYQYRQVPRFSMPYSPVQARLNVHSFSDQLGSHRLSRLFCIFTVLK